MTATLQAPEAPALVPSDAERLWHAHGAAMWGVACALLGDEAAATRAVRAALRDLLRVRTAGTAAETHRRAVRRVHARAEEQRPVAGDGTSGLPDVMLWVSAMASAQRASLALCALGGLTHREAGVVLGLPPGHVAALLTAGLREIGHRGATAPSCA